MELTASRISEITAYLDVTTMLPFRADLLFVFGTRLATPAHLAAELYQQRKAPYVVVTGGQNRKLAHHNEADAHYDILIGAGVSPEHIIKENRSTNTLENVTFACPLIEKKVSLASTQSIIVVCKWMHSRRALMTLKRHLPEGIRYFACTYEPAGIMRTNWHQNPRQEGASVFKEWERIPQLLERGHIAEIALDGNSYV